VSRPPLDRDRLQAGAVAGYDVEVVEQAASTNLLVADRARRGAREGLVVVAEHQTAGRGRLDRVWTTPARSALTLSVLLRPALAPASWPWLPLMAGVAVAGALREVGAPDVALKWPNDVLLGTHKVAGLLVERVETPTGPAAVLGIGLNVSTTHEELPVEMATSLGLRGLDVDRSTLLMSLLAAVRREYGAWRAGGDRALHASYSDLCGTLGRIVRVDLPTGETLVGEARRVAAGGGLVVRGLDGDVTVGAGDVVHVRAAL
jgi:BirA family transcriptional regulator, biotin operon repressor / biotin---[acetyl-CoA-carboxylase] ligase